jgi:hypothetical protein
MLSRPHIAPGRQGVTQHRATAMKDNMQNQAKFEAIRSGLLVILKFLLKIYLEVNRKPQIQSGSNMTGTDLTLSRLTTYIYIYIYIYI